MRVIETADEAEAARVAAAEVTRAAQEAVAARGRAVIALSGGRTPWAMVARLRSAPVPWAALDIVQVDERVAPPGDEVRNLTHLRAGLPAEATLHPMAVEAADLAAAATAYAELLGDLAGRPPVIDLVQLGLGVDGHTASLVPASAVLEVADRDVAVTPQPYQGHRRMTLTFPPLQRARRLLWLVTGAEKAPALRALVAADLSAPAGRLAARTVAEVVVVADRAALGRD